jgi:hypothetical protein
VALLDPLVAQQVAAGEVVDRPASVVKELCENALDAGATRVEVEVADGGRERLLVRDDGSGMAEEDAKLSVLRHATSKIRTATDIESVMTLGISSTVPSEASKTNILGSPSCRILKRTPGTKPVVRTRSTSCTSDHSNLTFGPEKMRSKAPPRSPGREQRRLPPSSLRRKDTRGHGADITYPSSSCQLAPLIQTFSFISLASFREVLLARSMVVDREADR